jgi:hypothetical protein
MKTIPIPEAAKLGRPDCNVSRMGPPMGVDEDDCATTEMLISRLGEDIPNYPARRQYAYYQPNEAELERLRQGGFIEFCQYGNVVQPFSATVWPVTPVPEPRDTSAQVSS